MNEFNSDAIKKEQQTLLTETDMEKVTGGRMPFDVASPYSRVRRKPVEKKATTIKKQPRNHEMET